MSSGAMRKMVSVFPINIYMCITTAEAHEILSFRHVFTSNIFWNGIHRDQHHTQTDSHSTSLIQYLHAVGSSTGLFVTLTVYSNICKALIPDQDV